MKRETKTKSVFTASTSSDAFLKRIHKSIMEVVNSPNEKDSRKKLSAALGAVGYTPIRKET